jgi:septal ring factor EnvC (AmiA/AmiB activator)
MIDKKISVGTIITLATILGTFMFTQGATDNRLDVIESDAENTRKKVMSNKDKTQSLEVKIARIESKIDEGFKNLERLLIEN